jgi:cellulose synthase/poly-beta-1,6-N-acetylglucosamine synthase-like glycosyltransferase
MGYEFAKTAVFAFTNLAQALLFLTGVFYLLLSLPGFFKGRRTIPSSKTLKFAVLLPAYNEEKVIRFSVESFKRMDYPAGKFDLFLVADHCTDATAAIAAGLGAKVLDHSGPGRLPGKGRALKWATEQILASGGYDAFCYFDADSLAHPRFLKVMNSRLAAGEEAVQGRQLAKNTGCWLARILASAHIISNRFFQRPKYLLGLSATLHGKGMCFSRAVAARHQWDETCLTEDLEMQMRLIRHGVRITWAEDAIVYDEEPESLRQYVRRNVRWTRGSLDTARRHLAALSARAVMRFDPRAFEGAVYSAQTFRLGVVSLTAALIWLTRDSFNLFFWLYHQVPGSETAVKMMNIFPLALYPAAALLMEKVKPEIFAAYFLQPALGVLRFPVFIAGFFRGSLDWGRTDHVSQVAISDLVEQMTIQEE